MSEHTVAQRALDMAQRALSRNERHEAICEEAEKRRALFERNIDAKFEQMRQDVMGAVRSMQETYQTGQQAIEARTENTMAEISLRHSNAIRTVTEGFNTTINSMSTALNTAITVTSNSLSAFIAKQDHVNDNANSRFMRLLVGALSSITAITVFLLIAFLRKEFGIGT